MQESDHSGSRSVAENGRAKSSSLIALVARRVFRLSVLTDREPGTEAIDQMTSQLLSLFCYTMGQGN